MPGEEEKSKAKDAPASKGSNNKKEEKEPELTEEEAAKKDEVDLLATRAQDTDEGVQLAALKQLREEIRTSTSSMTSIPLALKFLRAHYSAFLAFFDKVSGEENKKLYADILSVLAMTMSEAGTCDTLRFKLRGHIDSLEPWGHEYVRALSGELAVEFAARSERSEAVDELLPLIENVLSFNMKHNAEPEACDLLLEVEKLELLPAFVDKANCERVCLYLIASAAYAPETEDVAILRCVMDIYKAQGMTTQALVMAMKLGDIDAVSAIYTAAEGEERKQLALMLGRHHMFAVEEDDDDLLNMIGNTQLSEHFLSLARDLDVMEPKHPDDIYKTHLLDSRYASNLAQHVDSAKQNLASSFVSAFVNAGFLEDKLLNDEKRTWVFKNKDEGKISATAALGMINMWDVEEGPNKMSPLLQTDDQFIRAGACLGIGVLCCGVQSEFDFPHSLLPDHLTAPQLPVRVASILGFAIAKAGTSDMVLMEDLLGPTLLECEASLEELAACALALGMAFVGTGNGDIAEQIMTVLQIKADELAASTHTRFLCLGLGLLFVGRQSEADLMLEVLNTLTDESVKQYALMTVQTCAYAGTGNVLKIQQLMHACGDHLEKDNDFQSVAVLGIALISMGDSIAREMSRRTFDHMLQYGDSVVRRAVPLALALTSLSHPQIAIVDTLSKLSHDQDEEVSQGSIFALGLVSAGTNNSRVAGLLRNLSAYYSKEPNHLFVVRLAQGLLHMGKGLTGINPFHSHNQLVSLPALGGVLTVLHSFLDLKNIIHGKYHYFLMFLATAMSPRMLMTVNEDMKPLTVPVRVGQAVDTVGQAGKPKAITGFQTHDTPVLLGPREKAELATNEYLPVNSFLEGIVILKKNPDFESE
eukprot:TRINITY_DN7244_c0_g1_i1.p1 TRINITY_DN7244_c0_g1~~TRINITY_DN7244_c0_g1_i1.p1  ORF type:complete len:871 (-),score=390.59 TRINITY_DN7244_c0_g1_i1:48-2660(-)